MTLWREHRDWVLVLLLGAVAGFLTMPWLMDLRATAEQEQQDAAQQATRLRGDYDTLAADAAAAEKLRAELGADAWRKLRAPPARVQLVATLRQFGVEAGLRDLDLTLGSATPTREPSGGMETWPLMASAITMKLSAMSDQQVFAFVQRAVRELPGDIRLERLLVQRQGGQTPVTASVALRWLVFAEEPVFARAPP